MSKYDFTSFTRPREPISIPQPEILVSNLSHKIGTTKMISGETLILKESVCRSKNVLKFSYLRKTNQGRG